MSLIACNCPNCGGQLDFDDSREVMFCSYCGTKVLRERVINITRNFTNNITNNFIIGNVHEVHSADWYFENIIELVKQDKEYDHLLERFKREYPNDRRVNYGFHSMRIAYRHYLEYLGESNEYIAHYNYSTKSFDINEFEKHVEWLKDELWSFPDYDEMAKKIDENREQAIERDKLLCEERRIRHIAKEKEELDKRKKEDGIIWSFVIIGLFIIFIWFCN